MSSTGSKRSAIDYPGSLDKKFSAPSPSSFIREIQGACACLDNESSLMRAGKSPGKRGWNKVDSVYPPEPEAEMGSSINLTLFRFCKSLAHFCQK